MNKKGNAPFERRPCRLASAGLRIVLFAMLTAHSSSDAKAFCVEPSFNSRPPEAPGPYRRPVVPSCLKEFKTSQKHSCESFEIAAYFDEVNSYIRALNDYVTRAKSFASDADAFAKDVTAFALCDSKLIKRQHK